MPFTESELALWEDHWIITAQKLQQVSLSPRDLPPLALFRN
jgi:hypothetical protein